MGAELEVTKFRKVTGLFGAGEGAGLGARLLLKLHPLQRHKNVPDARSLTVRARDTEH